MSAERDTAVVACRRAESELEFRTAELKELQARYDESRLLEYFV